MIDCISVENMRLSDAYTIANLVPSLELMYRAAYGVFKAVNWHGRTAIVVGSGNYGGDGHANGVKTVKAVAGDSAGSWCTEDP